ncbi:unnamed protein product [Cladocopium goreaui]|uniref:Uncharacterized protein n=1 Tax=Cladocopium goreaui TaxID=2562237 RepID=A0A9P1BLQ7_9DINO|nr:unnamed protein product [Cladocopium goreaui]
MAFTMTRPDVAFPPQILSRQWSAGFNGAEKNRLHGGELWMKKPAALPSKERFHVSKQQDEDWWLRHNDRANCKPDPGFCYYVQSPLLKRGGASCAWRPKTAGAAAVEQRKAFVEETSKLLEENPRSRKEMAERYAQVMRSPSVPLFLTLQRRQRPHTTGY